MITSNGGNLSNLMNIHREKAQSNKTPALMKSINMYIWVVCTSNKVFRSSSCTKINIFQKTKQLLAKLRSWQSVHFVLPILFILTFASGLAVLWANVTFIFSTFN